MPIGFWGPMELGTNGTLGGGTWEAPTSVVSRCPVVGLIWTVLWLIGDQGLIGQESADAFTHCLSCSTLQAFRLFMLPRRKKESNFD